MDKIDYNAYSGLKWDVIDALREDFKVPVNTKTLRLLREIVEADELLRQST